MSAELALFAVHVIAAINVCLSRAAFASSSASLSPISYALWRSMLASLVFATIRKLVLTRPTPQQLKKMEEDAKINNTNNRITENASSNGDESNNRNNNNDEVVTKVTNFDFSTPVAAPPWRDVLKACFLGGFVINGVLTFYLYGMRATDGITLAAMQATISPIVFVIGYLFGSEKFTATKVVATALCVIGILIMCQIWTVFPAEHVTPSHIVKAEVAPVQHPKHLNATHQHLHRKKHGHSYFVGVFCIFLSNTCWAIYMLLQKHVVPRMHICDFLFYLMSSLACGLFVLSLIFIPHEHVLREGIDGELPVLMRIAILYAVFHCCSGYFLTSYGIAYSRSILLPAIFSSLEPPFIAILAVLFLGESLDRWICIGGSVIFCGVATSLIDGLREAAAARKKDRESAV